MMSQQSNHGRINFSAATMGLLLCGASAMSQINVIQVRDDAYSLASEVIDNQTSEPTAVFVGTVDSPGASAIRLHIGDYNLGRSSYVTLTSVTDDAVQRLDAKTIPSSYNWSVTFNGDSVEVELHVGPGDTGVFIEIDRTRTRETSEKDDGAVASICGTNDDRVPSSDARVGRISSGPGGAYCTAWLISNGAVLTAGHCIPTAGDYVEFGVPASLGNGIDVAASPLNQYPINLASVVNENGGVGMDWMVFGLNANTTTFRTAHNFQGFFRMTNTIPDPGTVLRITGFGLDSAPAGVGTRVCVGGTNQNAFCASNANCLGGGVCPVVPCCDPDGTGPLPCGFNCNSASQTQQTATGALGGSNANLITHFADTMPANSGSPIIWEANGLTIGIHTAGGCAATGPGSNAGTRFSRTVLETAIRNFAGPNPVYVDTSDYDFPSNGGVFEPFHNIMQAIGAVLDNGTISLVPGFYTRQNDGIPIVIGADGKGMTIVSPAGSSFIGS